MNQLHVFGRNSVLGFLLASGDKSVIIVLKLEAFLPSIVIQPEPIEEVDDITGELDFDGR